MPARTISEKILSMKSGRDARAGDLVICNVDYAMATDGSAPLAIDYFEQMGGDEVFEVYLRAKAEADAALEASDREWTILRPGGLTDDAGTGSVRIDSAPFSGPVPRDDLASVLARLLADSRSAGRVLYLSSGAQPIEQALDEVLGITEKDAS